MRDIDRYDSAAGWMRTPRSRGAVGGILLVLSGALIPLVGPYVDLAHDPDTPWTWTAARGWLEVLPGALTVLGGLLLLFSANRATALFGGWLAVVAGAWFVVARLLTSPLGLGDFGPPTLISTGVGSLIIALGGMALGRLSVRSVRDIRYARPSVDEYHRADWRETIARERATVTESDVDGNRPPAQRQQRDWRHPLGGRRPVPH